MNKQSILITGGTGSFGQAFVAEVIRRFPKIHRLVIFSRDELKQFEMAQKFLESKHKNLRFFIGDVRDRARLRRALEGIDVVVHSAALKQVPAAEYNPMEFIHTNVLGAENLIEASVDAGVKRVVALSTDKEDTTIRSLEANNPISSVFLKFRQSLARFVMKQFYISLADFEISKTRDN